MSRYGQEHVKCFDNYNGTANDVVCTLPRLMNDSLCRRCEDVATGDIDEQLWRCDDGSCISKAQFRNGKLDCPDGSDELRCKSDSIS